MAIDQFGRKIHYLRISLTDHCNLRCIYCMPEEMSFRPLPEMMQDDEVLQLTRLFATRANLNRKNAIPAGVFFRGNWRFRSV